MRINERAIRSLSAHKGGEGHLPPDNRQVLQAPSVRSRALERAQAALRRRRRSPYANRHELLSLYIPLLPSILGLCFARTGLIVAGYGSYTHTDEGIFTDGSMLVALSFMAVILLVIGTRKIRLKKRTTNRIMRTCVALEALCVLLLPLTHIAGAFWPNVHFWLCAAVTFFASGSPSSIGCAAHADAAHHRRAVCVQQPLPSVRWRFTFARSSAPTASTLPPLSPSCSSPAC